MPIRSQYKNISIIGAGSWGTSIALTIAETYPDISICMWAYEKNVVSSINTRHENTQFLPNVTLPGNIKATGSVREAVSSAEIILLSTPSKVIPDICQRMRKHIKPKTHVGFLTKGFCKIHNEIFTISQTIERIIPELKDRTVAVYGPSHAEEVSLHYHTCLNVAGKNVTARKVFVHFLSSHSVQCRETDDIIGVEMGGTLKNPAAIAAGMISVLPNCGDNLAGALISEALKEMLRIGRLFDVRDETLIDISGLGDLVATALSDHSRNRRFGKDIGRQIAEKGNALRIIDRIILKFKPQMVLEKMSENLHYLAEGAYAIEPLIELAEQHGVSIPVYRSLYEVLLNKKDPSLLIETIKNPERFEEILRRTKIQVSDKKKGMENVGGRAFRGLIESKVLDSLTGKDGVKEGGPFAPAAVVSDMALYDQSRCSPEERRILDTITENNYEREVRKLVKYYISTGADLYSMIMNRFFMFILSLARTANRLSGRGGAAQVYGDINQVRSLADMGNPIYVCPYSSISDPFIYLATVRKSQLPFPRFMVHGESVTGKMERLIIRLAGGFIIDEGKVSRIVYREVVKQYLSTLIEHGVPILYFPERRGPQQDGNAVAGDEFYAMLSEIMFRHTVEILLIPAVLSHAEISDESEKSLLSFRKHVSNNELVSFSDPIFLSEFTRDTESLSSIGERIKKAWKRDRKIFSHVLLAKILADNNFEVELKQIESLFYKYLRFIQLSPPSKIKKFINSGVMYLRKQGTAVKEDGYIRAVSRDRILDYAKLLPW